MENPNKYYLIAVIRNKNNLNLRIIEDNLICDLYKFKIPNENVLLDYLYSKKYSHIINSHTNRCRKLNTEKKNEKYYYSLLPGSYYNIFEDKKEFYEKEIEKSQKELEKLKKRKMTKNNIFSIKFIEDLIKSHRESILIVSLEYKEQNKQNEEYNNSNKSYALCTKIISKIEKQKILKYDTFLSGNNFPLFLGWFIDGKPINKENRINHFENIYFKFGKKRSQLNIEDIYFENINNGYFTLNIYEEIYKNDEIMLSLLFDEKSKKYELFERKLYKIVFDFVFKN